MLRAQRRFLKQTQEGSQKKLKMAERKALCLVLNASTVIQSRDLQSRPAFSKFQPSDILWVRQAFAMKPAENSFGGSESPRGRVHQWIVTNTIFLYSKYKNLRAIQMNTSFIGATNQTEIQASSIFNVPQTPDQPNRLLYSLWTAQLGSCAKCISICRNSANNQEILRASCLPLPKAWPDTILDLPQTTEQKTELPCSWCPAQLRKSYFFVCRKCANSHVKYYIYFLVTYIHFGPAQTTTWKNHSQ